MGKKDKKKNPQKGNSNRVVISNIPKTSEQRKQLHQRAMSDWPEGERKLNENKRKHDEYWRKRHEEGKKQMHYILSNWSSIKKQPKLVCNLKANTKK